MCHADVWAEELVQVEDLLHELICGEGHGLGGHTADVVERKASVQSLLDPVLLVHVCQGLAQRPVSKNTDKDRAFTIIYMSWVRVFC